MHERFWTARASWPTLAAAALLGGCTLLGPPEGKQSMAENKADIYASGPRPGAITVGGSAASAPATAAAPAAAAVPAATAAAAAPGMNSRGEVVDSSKVEAGHGKKVKGIDGWEGEIIGIPIAGAKFERLQIGMDMSRSLQIAGEPAWGGTRVSSTTFNPLYSGNDKYKRELIYPGVGRLVFGDSVGWSASSGGRLIWIIYNPNEPVPPR